MFRYILASCRFGCYKSIQTPGLIFLAFLKLSELQTFRVFLAFVALRNPCTSRSASSFNLDGMELIAPRNDCFPSNHSETKMVVILNEKRPISVQAVFFEMKFSKENCNFLCLRQKPQDVANCTWGPDLRPQNRFPVMILFSHVGRRVKKKSLDVYLRFEGRDLVACELRPLITDPVVSFCCMSIDN